MRVAIDSSSMAKRYVKEAGSKKLDTLLQDATELALCIIAVPEIISGLNRKLRDRVLTNSGYNQAKKQLLDDVGDSIVLQLTPAIISHSVKLLEENTLRAMDALHVACAIEWQPDLFITSDKRQLAAILKIGLPAKYIG